MSLAVRPLNAHEFPAWAHVIANAQGRDHDEASLARMRSALRLDRAWGAFEGADPVGGIAAVPREMTMPGGLMAQVAGIACAAVAPTHRRRGIFAQLVRGLFTDMYENRRESVAVLNSEQAGVYTRFGFGRAVQTAVLEGDLDALEVRPDVEVGAGRVTLVEADAAAPLMRRVHARGRLMNVGWVEREAHTWDVLLADATAPVAGLTSMRFAIHWDTENQPQGYALYRFQVGTDDSGRNVTRLLVPEVVAAHRAAYGQLWNFLLNLDAARTLRAECAPDEPMQYMVADPQALRWTIRDLLAVRLVDVQAALAARRYSAPVDVVIEVTDHLCDWNHGRFRLQADEQGAMCVRSRDEAQLSMPVSALAEAYLGGTSLVSLALAGRVLARHPVALQQAAVAMRGFREPSCPSGTSWPWY